MKTTWEGNMLYKKNGAESLDNELFKKPTSEYRGAPFWAWNDRLVPEELVKQIGYFREMGFGGFHMHTRSGMSTPYLSTEFMNLVKLCSYEAKKNRMLAWLYDEDRWPSGAAGGIVTSNPAFREKKIRFTVTRDPEADERRSCYFYNRSGDEIADASWINEGKKYLLACYKIELNKDGALLSYSFCSPEDADWYVYVETDSPSGWFNGQTYVDTMSEEAVGRFIEVTYGAYEKAVGKEFGKTVPAIFTDEPQFLRKSVLPFASDKSDVTLPWTTDFPKTFRNEFGFDLIYKLPELIWDLPEGKPSRTRYLYHEHACQRFTDAFAKQCGTWCDAHGISLTGHMMEEHSLHSQTSAIGEAMRAYRYFGIPGIDVLCDNFEPTTAKQCSSAVHQWGKEGMTSELYGVTGWDFDFRGHKFQGDWQAAFGVTVRVPHLTWYSMRGSAKRDYPASIGYQSSWYKDYGFIEDHFARLNTALTRGKADIRVGVIHPVESYWLNFGPAENTSLERATLDRNFTQIIDMLLDNSIDFDFISESQLPLLEKKCDDAQLNVGEMKYSVVLIPDVTNLRQTTAESLIRFADRGGLVVSTGRFPEFIDAEEGHDDLLGELRRRCCIVPFFPSEIVKALDGYRSGEIRYEDGYPCNTLFISKRNDRNNDWFFIAHIKRVSKFSPENVRIILKGTYKLTEYDTVNGDIKPISDVSYENGNTVIKRSFYRYDSLLLCAEPLYDTTNISSDKHNTSKNRTINRIVDYPDGVDFERSEPNVAVLDMPEWSLDGITFEKKLEMLRIDELLRNKFGYPLADGHDVQPWCIPEETISIFPTLKFIIDSEIEAECSLAYEGAEKVILNGVDVPVVSDGWFTDHSIKTMRLPALAAGKNELIIKAPFGKRVSLENYFLLGDFDVSVAGSEIRIKKPERLLHFGDITRQGMPFYGGKITYYCPIETEKNCDLKIHLKSYSGAVVDVSLDGEEMGKIVFEPCDLILKDVHQGKHQIALTICLSRVNCFTSLHNSSGHAWIGPSYWYRRDDGWSNEYIIKQCGILCSPEIAVFD